MNPINPIWATEPAPNVSDKYQFIPTYKIIRRFEDEGFATTKVSLKQTRSPHNNGFGEHMVRMRHVSSNSPDLDEVFPEVVIVNSHNRTKALRIGLGFFRLVCSNGLITGQFLMHSGQIKHTGMGLAERVLEYVDRHTKDVSEKIRRISDMKQVILNPDEQLRFATQAAAIVNPQINRPMELLLPNRYEDRKPDLWSLFNNAQENAMKGLYQINGATNLRKARPIKNVSRDVEVNAKLWQLAEDFA